MEIRPRWPGMAEWWAVSTGVIVGWRDLTDSQEVALVIVGDGQLHLAQLFGQVLVVAPILVGGFKSPAVHPYPAIGADPFGAAANIG